MGTHHHVLSATRTWAVDAKIVPVGDVGELVVHRDLQRGSGRSATLRTARPPVPGMTRFPGGFLWGVATSAFQIEGAAHDHRWRDDVELAGRTLSREELVVIGDTPLDIRAARLAPGSRQRVK